MDNIFADALGIISKMEKEKVSPNTFIHNNIECFSDIPLGSLIAPECRLNNFYSEKAYVFLIGSYIYFRVFAKTVTWFERHRFAEFPMYSELFRRTVCAEIERRIASLDELKKIILKQVEKSSSPLSPEGVIGMRIAIKCGSVITLKEVGTNNEHEFTIVDTVGVGASCIVYTAVHHDAEGNDIQVRLKEFYPESLDIKRNADNSLDMKKSNFSRYLKRFTEGYRRQITFRNVPKSMNSISSIQGIFEGNNTKYIAMSCQNGTSIDNSELSLYDIFRLFKAVTLQLNNLHKNGFLYLDLKPANIILYPETPELVMLFDFDSAVKFDEIALDDLSFTQKWSAPEVIRRKVKNIGIPADIYTLGALLMYMLFHRSPELYDRRRSADWSGDFDNSILADESPEVKRMVTEIFRNTLSAEPERRYASCYELLDVIEPFIQSFHKQKPYLQTILPLNSNYFCGRDREIKAINEQLQSTHFLVLHGIGGIGKTELAKRYAQKFSSEYDAVIFVRYDTSIIETFANDVKLPIANLKRDSDESDEVYFKRKLSVLQKISTPRHLIILDNFDTDECDDLDELMALNFKFLITSRVDFEDIFPQFEVGVLNEMDSLRDIFSHYSKLENDKYSDDIIIALEGHTMAVELVSKQMKQNELSSEEMYDMLCKNGISADENKVKNMKDGSLRNKSAVAHIETLFNVLGVADDVRQILRNAALIGPNPVTIDWFSQLCELDNNGIKTLDRCISGGWIQKFDEIILLHSLIAEVLYRQLKPNSTACRILLENLIAVTENLDEFSGDMRKAHIAYLDYAARKIIGSDKITADFLENTATYVYAYERKYSQAVKTSERLLDILQNSLNEDKDRIDATMLMIAAYARYSGDMETSQKNEDILLNSKISREVISIKFLTALNANDYDTAIIFAEELLKVSKSTYDYFDSYRCLYMAESRIGNTEKAAEYASSELEYLEKYLAENEDETAPKKLSEMYSAAGDAYRDCCEYVTAIDYYTRSLKIMESSLGERHIYSADYYFNIGLCYVKNTEFEKGLEFADISCQIVLNHYGRIHYETAEYLQMLSELYNAAYSYSADDNYLNRAVEIQKEIQDIEVELDDDL